MSAIDVTATALEHTKEKIMQRQKLACLSLVFSILALFGAVALAQQPEELTPPRSAPMRLPRAPITEAEIAALPQTESLSLSPEQTAIPLGTYTAVVQQDLRIGPFLFFSGEYQLTLLGGGKYQLGLNDFILQSGNYTVTQGAVEFSSPAGQDVCSNKAVYQFQLQGNRLTFTTAALRAEGCTERVVLLTSAAFFKNDPAPNVWKNIGPTGGRILSLLAHDGKLFAGADGGGVLISADNGQSWKATKGIRLHQTLALAASGGVLFAGGTGSLGVYMYVSTDGGETWEFVLSNLTTTVFDFVESGGRLYAATLGNGVWRMGATPYLWEKVGTTGLTNQVVTTLAASGNNLFAGTDGGGIFRSTDGGNTWTAVNTGLTQPRIRALAVDGAKLYASSAFGSSATVPNEVFVSENNGQTWARLGNGIAADFPAGFTNSAFDLVPLGGKLFATGSSGVLMFDGAKWSAVHSGSPTTSFFSITASGNTLFAGAWFDGVSRSTDGGVTWTKTNNGLTGRLTTSVHKDNGVLYAGVNDGLFISRDEGQTWTRGLIASIPSILCFLSHDGKVYAGARNFSLASAGVYVTSDQGQNWTRVSTGLPNGSVYRLIAVGNVLYAAVFGGGVFRSADGGANWTAVNTGLGSLQVYDVIALGNHLFASTANQGIFRSNDNGQNWTAASTGLPAGAILNMTVVGNTLLAAVVGQAIYRSSDNGQTWTKSQNGVMISFTNVLYTHNGVVYAGPSGGVGVLRSTDEGRTWQPVNGGFDSRFVTFGFYGSGSTLYVASYNGVYVSQSLVNRAATVSAASFRATIADKNIVAAFGPNLATRNETAASLPLPTNLAGTTVKVRDSLGVERLAPLFFVSAGQVNYQIPAGTATGTANITITNSDGIGATGEINVVATAPALFTLSGTGTGAAAAVDALTGAAAPFNATQANGQPNIIAFFGTGLGADATDVDGNVSASVTARLDGNPVTLQYAGRAPGLTGANQFNVVLPAGLAAGTHTLTFTRAGVTSNAVTIVTR